jgi:hypothetical protein
MASAKRRACKGFTDQRHIGLAKPSLEAVMVGASRLEDDAFDPPFAEPR